MSFAAAISRNQGAFSAPVQRSGKGRVEAVFFSDTVNPAGITGGGKASKQ